MSLLDGTYALIAPTTRSIASVIPDVVMEERHRDSLIITQHPVEKGAAITDHAFKRPPEVDMLVGFSNSSAGSEGYTRQIYQTLLALQQSRQPFDVFTGKRAYTNMLVADIGVVTDKHSENILALNVRLQNIIIVSTQTTGTGTSTTSAGSGQGDQANPESTGSVSNSGDQQGSAVGDQDFAGSFNPGSTNTEGGTLGSPGFGDLGPPSSEVSGLARSETLPEISVTAPSAPEGVTVDPYNVFGA